MTYQTSVTQKGQITIPKKFREELGIRKNTKVLLRMKRGGITIEPAPTILDLANSLKPQKARDAVSLRKTMEKQYGILR